MLAEQEKDVRPDASISSLRLSDGSASTGDDKSLAELSSSDEVSKRTAVNCNQIDT